jgi:spore maturation protein CgeB
MIMSNVIDDRFGLISDLAALARSASAGDQTPVSPPLEDRLRDHHVNSLNNLFRYDLGCLYTRIMSSVFFLKQSSIVRGNAHVERYIEHAFERAAGVRLISFDLVTEARNVNAAGAESTEEIYRRYRDYIIKRIRDERADIFLVINGYAVETLFAGFFEQVRGLGVTTVAWHADDPYYVDLQESIAGHFDCLLTVDSSTVDFWRQRAPCVCWFPFAFATESVDGLWSDRSPDQYVTDVCFIGAPFAGSRRVRIVDENAGFLAGLNVRLMGATSIDTWQKNLRNYEILRDKVHDAFVEPSEAVRYFCAARINLNIHKDSSGHAWDRNRRRIIARSPNERLFAIAGTGAFQLVDNLRPDLASMFPREALATFDADAMQSPEDEIRYYLAHESERREIAGRLQRLVLAEHTYDARIARLLHLF